MRKARKVELWAIDLKCEECGKEHTIYNNTSLFANDLNNLPEHLWRGWNLSNTEICPFCVAKKRYPKRGV
jgi:hypothetical protein